MSSAPGPRPARRRWPDLLGDPPRAAAGRRAAGSTRWPSSSRRSPHGRLPVLLSALAAGLTGPDVRPRGLPRRASACATSGSCGPPADGGALGRALARAAAGDRHAGARRSASTASSRRSLDAVGLGPPADVLRRPRGRLTPRGRLLPRDNTAATPRATPPPRPLCARRPVRDGDRVVVPLHGQARLRGVLAVAASPTPRRSHSDLDVLDAVGQQAGLALDRAVLFEHTPTSPASSSTAAGRRPAGRPAVRGQRDVPARRRDARGGRRLARHLRRRRAACSRSSSATSSGAGCGAASAMGQLRSAVRAIGATRGVGPASLLARLDRFVEQVEAASMATLAYAELDPRTGELRYACAGHPPPVLVPAGVPYPRLLWDGRSTPLGALRARHPGRGSGPARAGGPAAAVHGRVGRAARPGARRAARRTGAGCRPQPRPAAGSRRPGALGGAAARRAGPGRRLCAARRAAGTARRRGPAHVGSAMTSWCPFGRDPTGSDGCEAAEGGGRA